MRTPIVAGNWKMNMTGSAGAALAAEIKEGLAGVDGVEAVVCPPFTALASVGAAIAGSAVNLGAQNMNAEGSGAFTGEISAEMLTDAGCGFVILGHSERRTLFGETDASVNAKTKAALAAGLKPIVCVGETLEEREGGKTDAVVAEQVRGSLDGLSTADFDKLVVAYEPVWAIGTGLTATPEQAQEVHALIRNLLSSMQDAGVAQKVRIQYGGSMKPDNAAELLSQPDIDGGLIGGASLDAASFIAIIKAAV